MRRRRTSVHPSTESWGENADNALGLYSTVAYHDPGYTHMSTLSLGATCANFMGLPHERFTDRFARDVALNESPTAGVMG